MRLRNVFLPLVIRIGLLWDGSRLREPLNSILSPGYAPLLGLALRARLLPEPGKTRNPHGCNPFRMQHLVRPKVS